MVTVKTQVNFEIDEDGNLSMKVAGIAVTDHAAVDKMLADIATAMGGERTNKEQLPLLQIQNKQTITN